MAHSLKDLRRRGLAAIEKDPQHHLPCGFREAVWAAYGPGSPLKERLGAKKLQFTKPQLSRAALAVAGALHVLPHWRGALGDDPLPDEALGAVSDLVRGALSFAEAQPIFDSLLTRARDIAVEKAVIETAAGYAAVCALSVAIFDEFFDAADLDLARPDEEDPEEWDSAYWAAATAAGGPTTHDATDSKKRLAFWRWWLEEATEIASDPEGFFAKALPTARQRKKKH